MVAPAESWVIFYASSARTVCQEGGRDGSKAKLSSHEPQAVTRLPHMAVELLRS